MLNLPADRDRELTDYFATNEFSKLLGIIQQYDSVDSERIKYKQQVIPGLSERKFSKVVETVFHNLESEVKSDGSKKFPHGYVDYEGLRFNVMLGQGSLYWTSRLE